MLKILNCFFIIIVTFLDHFKMSFIVSYFYVRFYIKAYCSPFGKVLHNLVIKQICFVKLLKISTVLAQTWYACVMQTVSDATVSIL